MTIDYDPQPRTCRIIDAGSVLAIEDICALAYSEAKFHLPRSPEWRSRLQAGADGISARVRRGEKIYGINTGYGDTCDRAVPLPLVDSVSVSVTSRRRLHLRRRRSAGREKSKSE